MIELIRIIRRLSSTIKDQEERIHRLERRVDSLEWVWMMSYDNRPEEN